MEKALPVWDFGPFMKLKYQVMKVADNTACTQAKIIMSANEAGPPLHYHPSQEESFKILSGKLEFYLHDKWQKLHTGDSITVPRNTPHTFKNSSENEVVLINTHEPALDFEAFMEKFYRLCLSGKIKRKPNLSTAIYLSMLWMEHKKELISVKPPAFIMMLLSVIGKIAGYRIR